MEKINKTNAFLFLLTFLYIFSLKIIGFLDSSILVGIILLIVSIRNKKYRTKIIKILFDKKKMHVYLTLFFLIIWSFLITTLKHVYDYSYIITLFHFLINIVIGYALYCYFKTKKNDVNIFNYIILAFLLQSILQWVFFIFPSFSSLFNFFRSEQMVSMQATYSGIKGISLCGSGFFSLTSGYALIIGLYFSKYNTLFQKNSQKIIAFIILLSGAFFAGRTCYIGLLIIPFIIYKKGKFKITKDEFKSLIKRYYKKALIFLFAIMVVISLTYQIDKFAKMYNYTFEIIVNVFSGNGLQTTSTNTLLSMYDIDLKNSNLLIGDGKYTIMVNGHETYYKNTDVGFFRRVLYFGLIGYIFCILLQYFIVENIEKYNKKLLIIILGLLTILELKGEILGINILVNSILVLFSQTVESEESNEKS